MSIDEILEELSFMDINDDNSFGDFDTESNRDDNGDEYDVSVAVGGIGIFPPSIIDKVQDILAFDVEVAGVAEPEIQLVDDDVDEGIFQSPSASEGMVCRECDYNISNHPP
ncbi:hypothetical protein JTB14_037985 [Gonioctena quinquepunctata]|nr:hypothetical protein JTB14_037985 [Gonioctena quinquepunctata]